MEGKLIICVNPMDSFRSRGGIAIVIPKGDRQSDGERIRQARNTGSDE